MHGVWELSTHCDCIQSLVSQATLFFLLNYKFCNLGGMALLKTACHMPLISLRDMPSATTVNDDSKKNMKKEKKKQKRRREEIEEEEVKEEENSIRF